MTVKTIEIRIARVWKNISKKSNSVLSKARFLILHVLSILYIQNNQKLRNDQLYCLGIRLIILVFQLAIQDPTC